MREVQPDLRFTFWRLMQIFLIMLADIKEEIMELRETLNKPYTDNEAIEFITLNNAIRKYKIKETESALEAWGFTKEELAEKERQNLDSLTLTPADVERALYKEKQMDFEDLKALIAQALPQIDTKALSIEFRAKDFYRGAMYGNVRLFDIVGQILGYTPEDMDYLFKNKELPNDKVG